MGEKWQKEWNPPNVVVPKFKKLGTRIANKEKHTLHWGATQLDWCTFTEVHVALLSPSPHTTPLLFLHFLVQSLHPLSLYLPQLLDFRNISFSWVTRNRKKVQHSEQWLRFILDCITHNSTIIYNSTSKSFVWVTISHFLRVWFPRFSQNWNSPNFLSILMMMSLYAKPKFT
jgi:hypothetical protein